MDLISKDQVKMCVERRERGRGGIGKPQRVIEFVMQLQSKECRRVGKKTTVIRQGDRAAAKMQVDKECECDQEER
jgi:hypothetical protein